MVEFKRVTNGGDLPGTLRINPAEVVALSAIDAGSITRILLTSGVHYDVPGTLAEVDDKLTAHYTDVRYLAFVVESLCTHLKVELTPPSQIKVEVIPPTPPPEQES